VIIDNIRNQYFEFVENFQILIIVKLGETEPNHVDDNFSYLEKLPEN